MNKISGTTFHENILVSSAMAILLIVSVVAFLLGNSLVKSQHRHTITMHTKYYQDFTDHIVNNIDNKTLAEAGKSIMAYFTSLPDIDAAVFWGKDGKPLDSYNGHLFDESRENMEKVTTVLSEKRIIAGGLLSETRPFFIPDSGSALLVVYVPVSAGGNLEGAIGIIEKSEHLLDDLNMLRTVIWSYIVWGGGVLYFLLFYIFYKSYRKQQTTNRKLDQTQDVTIYALGYQAELRDLETGKHLERTASYVKIIAEELRANPEYRQTLSDSYTRSLVKSAPLHDIGKVAIPDRVLLNPGKLSDEDFEIMKQHCIYGKKILEKAENKLSFASFLNTASDICLYHHEKWNGTGYPEGLSGTDIPLSARIMALADVYDALRSERRYKESFSHEKSLTIISNEKGKHFDPAVVDAFEKRQEDFIRIAEELSDTDSGE